MTSVSKAITLVIIIFCSACSSSKRLPDDVIDKEITELKLIVKERPTYIAIDPYGTRSDENRVDNILRLEP